MNIIEKVHESIDFKNLTYHYKGPSANVDFNNFNDVANIFDEIKSNRMKLADARKNKMELKSKLSNISIRSRKSGKQNSKMKKY